MKPLALLIPGLDGTGQLFYRQVERLSASYRVRAWEFRQRSIFDFPDLLEEIGKETAEEEPGSILVAGESFGGTIALHYVLAFPERVKRLALINTFPYYPRRIRIWLSCLLAPVLGFREAQRIKDLVVDRVLAREGILPEERREYRRIIKTVNLPAYRRRLELVQQVDLRPRLREITVTTMIFASGRDKVVPSVAQARFMASRIPGAALHEFPRAGHALLLTPGFSLADYA